MQSPAPFSSRRLVVCGILALLGASLSSCADEPDVVLYCSLDQMFSEELVQQFESKSGLDVRIEFDVEAAKTVGLVNRIREERSRPRCDVFWNNELAHTVALAEDGLLQPYDSPSAADIPEPFRDPQRRWTAFAARARVFIVNTDLADPSKIRSFEDLWDPQWKGKVAVARPLTGTTLTHFTALYAMRGEAGGDEIVSKLQNAGVSFVQSNGQVMRLVREGQMAWGLTDTDDFNVALQGGFPVAQVYPDQKDDAHPDAPGTLLIPNSVCLLKDAPHAENAKKLIDFILSKDVEAALAQAEGAQIPVRSAVPRPAHVRSAAELTLMHVDWAKVGQDIQQRLAKLKERFLQ
ncbi:MAG: extracellular solute-binding protein [Planctomycetes bacterium]|nr:extracellular solute-binding protein [Planctomycetota bacterium]